MKRALRKLDEGVSFRYISDAVEGLQILADAPPGKETVIFMDIKMPRLSGLDILAELQRQGRLAKIDRINMLSSSELSQDIEAALQYPNVRYYTKPEGYTGLCQLLAGVLSPTAKTKPTQ